MSRRGTTWEDEVRTLGTEVMALRNEAWKMRNLAILLAKDLALYNQCTDGSCDCGTCEVLREAMRLGVLPEAPDTAREVKS